MEIEKGFNGEPYTKIPNQILEALLQTKLQNYEIRLLLAIARKTYGFNKNSDYINQKQIEEIFNSFDTSELYSN
jgi:phage replication O-like protein O